MVCRKPNSSAPLLGRLLVPLPVEVQLDEEPLPEDCGQEGDPGGELGKDELVDSGAVQDDVVQGGLDELGRKGGGGGDFKRD